MAADPLPLFDEEFEARPGAFPARWMSVQHAACYLEVSSSTIRRWAHDGRLRSKLLPRGGRAFSCHVLVPLYKGEPTCGCGHEPAPPSPALLRLLDGRMPLLPTDPEGDGDGRGPGNCSVNPYDRYRWLARRRRRWPIPFWPR